MSLDYCDLTMSKTLINDSLASVKDTVYLNHSTLTLGENVAKYSDQGERIPELYGN